MTLQLHSKPSNLGFRRVNSIFAESSPFDEGPVFFARLVELSTLRNRLHVSNRNHIEPADEGDIFLDDAKIEAEKLCEEPVW